MSVAKVEMLRAACDQAMQGFALHDNDGNFTYVNPAQARMYGYAPEELLGKSWRLLYGPEETRRIDEESFPELLRSGAWSGELVGLRRDGRAFDVEVSLSLLMDESGERVGLVCNCRDISERKRTEAQLRQLQRLESLGQLTGGVAHDFNNILAVLIGSLELALDAPQSGETRELLQGAVDAAKRGVSVTNRLLSFARQQDLAPVPLDLPTLLHRIEPMLSVGLGDRIDIRIDCEPGLWKCKADPSELENALVNLALNGRDAMPSGGTLRISARNVQAAGQGGEAGDRVAVTVADTGVGMSRAVLERVFDPFFTTKPDGAGSGLGLSMVYGFASQTGGELLAESEPGNGARFTLMLPRHAALEEAPKPVAQAAPGGAGETVLLVEDEPAVRTVVRRQLALLGYRVTEAGTAPEALASLEGTTFDLLLSDVSLPGGIDGVELVKEVAERVPATRSLLMSGKRDLTPPAGVPLLCKPFTRRELALSIDALLRNELPGKGAGPRATR